MGVPTGLFSYEKKKGNEKIMELVNLKKGNYQ